VKVQCGKTSAKNYGLDGNPSHAGFSFDWRVMWGGGGIFPSPPTTIDVKRYTVGDTINV
jgi:hypothetical protein